VDDEGLMKAAHEASLDKLQNNFQEISVPDHNLPRGNFQEILTFLGK
jgi:hypothetical protein